MNVKRSILIVEDEEIIRTSLAEFLHGRGYAVEVTGSVEQAAAIARRRPFDIAICDVQLPDGDGLALMRRLQQIHQDLLVLVITAYATVENAVDAFKAGAFDYLVKPVIFEELQRKLEHLIQNRQLHLENQRLRQELARYEPCEQIIGSSQVLTDLHQTIRKVAVTNANVLLTGETGTGKELFARAIHNSGPKHREKFLTVNCGARPMEMLEVQLFGSNGPNETPGALRHAGEGTVFLDEVSLLPMGMQAELLRAIEYQEVIPVGGAEAIPIQTRIVTATTKDLSREVADSAFLEDLFYRLDGMKIPIPPLRERLDDIPELVEFFITKHSRSMGKRVVTASTDVLRVLMSNSWKGNVRQLDNAIERAVMMCEGNRIEQADLPPDLLGLCSPLPDSDDLRSALRHYERLHILRVLRQFPDKREAAKRLKLGLSSLYRKIEELQIET